MARYNPTRPFSRKGLHRLECACGAYLYGTVANLESRGLPTCACGDRFSPARRELADILGVRCEANVEFETALALGLSGIEAAEWVEGQRRARAVKRLGGRPKQT